jgi:hypothetical protein
MFGGINYKKQINEDTIQTVLEEFATHKINPEELVLNILNDLWIFEYKHKSWYKPIIGGKHPRRSYKYAIKTINKDNMHKFIFISKEMKKNKIYELCSSGKEN